MTLTEEDVFIRAARGICSGARGYVWTRGRGDPTPSYEITFRNGAEFVGGDKADVVATAKKYAEATFKLIGSYP